MKRKLNPKGIRMNISLLILVMNFFLFSSAWAGFNTWTSIGPEGGLISSIAVSPNYEADGTIFAGINGGGVYKSTNAGASWTQINIGITRLDVPSIALSPNYGSNRTVLVAAYQGVFKSTDGGANWTQINSGLHDLYIKIACSPNYDSDLTVFAATGIYGVLKSTDGGASWTEMNSGLTDLFVNSIALSPNYSSDQTIFAATNTGIFKSTDGGANWTEIDDGLSWLGGPFNAIAVSPNYVNDLTVFATVQGLIYKSTDGGASWTQSSQANYGSREVSIIFSQNYLSDSTVFVTGEQARVYKSTNGGSSWTLMNSGLTTSALKVIALSPNYTNDSTVFVGTFDKGIYKSVTGGSSWTLINAGIKGLEIRTIVLSPNYLTDRTIFVGTHGNGVYKSTNGGTTWAQINSGFSELEVTAVAVSPNYATDSTVFAGTRMWGIYKSVDGGTTWTNILLTVIDGIAISPNYGTDKTVFAIAWGGGVVKSTDAGASWTWINSGLTDFHMQSIVISPNFATDSIVFVGTEMGGVHKSTTGGATWYQVNPSWEIYSLAISPNFVGDQTVFFGTVFDTFKTADGGSNWTSTEIDPIVYSLAMSPNYSIDATVFAGTHYGGVNKSTDGGSNWNQMNTGLTNTQVLSMAISPTYVSDHTVFAGTNGNSVFIYTLVQQHTITASVGANGSISPSGSVAVNLGDNQSFTIMPNTGYHVADVIVDGTSAGAVTSYTFYDVTEDHTISTSFALNPDITPPSTPGNLHWDSITTTSVNLAWNPSADNVGVVGYKIYNPSDASLIAVTNNGTSYPVTGLTPGETYSFYVRAYDAESNQSYASNICSVTLPSSISTEPALPGNNVEVPVQVNLPSGGTTTITVEFNQVTSGGTVEIAAVSTPPAPSPTGFRLLDTVYYINAETITYTSPVLVTIHYDEPQIAGFDETNLRMFHWENGAWKDVTVEGSIDTFNNTITGRVDVLSPFVIGWPYGPWTGYSTGANENMLAVIAIMAISGGLFILRRKRGIF